ncbi:hypothetical protein AV530_017015 [Patagioenas fasciata monilis]|uniref:Uncharacterized protein n=1 Tax=Patagioenas fasciata monilis TaxID=372326 RepID=A0A1V4J4P8_PATFA|nr:hypothetical protein AV530_017015 [Patagioenas fasciata monilis]
MRALATHTLKLQSAVQQIMNQKCPFVSMGRGGHSTSPSSPKSPTALCMPQDRKPISYAKVFLPLLKFTRSHTFFGKLDRNEDTVCDVQYLENH